MGNPADKFKEVDKAFVSPLGKQDVKAVDEFLAMLKRETRYQAIVTEIPALSDEEKSSYTVDIYMDTYASPPTHRDVKMYRLSYRGVATQFLAKFTPVFVRMAADGCVLVEEEMVQYLRVGTLWRGGGPNRLTGKPAAGPTTPGATNYPNSDIHINILYPYFVGQNETLEQTGARFFGSFSRIEVNSIIPYRRYESAINNARYGGSIPLSIPADTEPTYFTIGLAEIRQPLPYGTGKYRILQIIDDLNPGTLGFDGPRIGGNVTPEGELV